jgi:hypothetical protein
VVTPDEGGEPAWCDVQDKEKWTSELVNAFGGFARGKTWGGASWGKCVGLLLELERRHDFPDKGMLKAPWGKDEHPKEVTDFMAFARRWGNPFPLQTEIGSREKEGSFAARWWTWWEVGQPAARLKGEDGWVAPKEMDASEWEEMSKRHGRNGMLLYIGGLLWWGEAATGDEE